MAHLNGLKPYSKQCGYRSGEPLRHPRSKQNPIFSQAVKRCLPLALQVLLHAPDTGHITFLHGFSGGDRPQICPVVDERAGGYVEGLSFFGNHDHQFGRNATAWLGVFRADLGTARGRTGQLNGASSQDGSCGGDHPSEKASPASMHTVLQSAVQAVTESERHFHHSFIAVQLDHVAGAIEHSGTVFSSLQVVFHAGAGGRIDLAPKAVRNISPPFFAADYHGLVPFAKDSLLLQLASSPGESRSRNIRRALS